MGTKFNFKCKGCGYKVTASGGVDYGLIGVTKTFICSSCNNIVDVCVGEFGSTYTREEILEKMKGADSLLSFYTCPGCGSGEDLAEWNKQNKPCPRCKGKMVKDRHGGFILWD
jgi:transcription initiation factor IIE alpha subunit